VNAIDYKSLKKDFRKSILAKIAGQSPDDLRAHSLSIQNNIVSFFKQMAPLKAAHSNSLWGCYQSLSGEPQINFDLVKSFLETKLEFAYPKVIDQSIQFLSHVDQWQVSQLNVQEPINGQEIALNQLAGLLIPAVAFHRTGYRLGRGLGFYDRTFAQFTGLKVGICYELNYLNNVPYESHDLCMDYIITEKQIYKIDKIQKQENSK